MKKNIFKLITLIISSMLILSGCSKMPDNVVATVNGVEITQEDFDKTLAKIGEDNGFTQIYGEDIWDKEIEPGKTFRQKFAEQMLDIMIVQEIAYQEAKKENTVATQEEIEAEFKAYTDIVNKDERYAESMKANNIDDEFVKRHLEKTLTYNNYIKNSIDKFEVTDEDLQKYYDENIENYKKDEVNARHILISTMDETQNPISDEAKAEKMKLAQEILDRVKKGEDFGKLAKEYSDDPGSAQKGGELGFFGKGIMVPEFEEAAFSLGKGEISNIVTTNFGYHIIQVLDKNEEVISLDSIKEELRGEIKYSKYSNKIKELVNAADVKVNDKFAKTEVK